MARVVFVGMDMLAGALARLSARADVTLALVATGAETHPCGGVRALAAARGVPILSDPDDDALVADVAAAGAQYLLTGAYHRKLPASRLAAGGVTALNLHPSLLPEGRGPTPVLHFALDPALRPHAGVTLHVMTDRFDAGPIVLRRPIALEAQDGYDDIEAKMFVAAAQVTDVFFDAPDAHLAAAQPQGDGSYWPRPGEQGWTLPAGATVAEARALRRRMGSFGARINLTGGAHFYGRLAVVAAAPHDFEPGALIMADARHATVALRDGLARVALF